MAGELDDAAVGRDVAAEDRQAAVGRERIVERAHDPLAGGLPALSAISPDRGAGDGDRALVQQAGLLEALQHERHAARGVQVGRDIVAERLQVAEQRGARADRVEVVDRQLDADLLRDREQMQHAVGGAATHGDRGDRVLQAGAW